MKYKFLHISNIGNSKGAIIPVDWIRSIFGIDNEKEILNKRFDIDYDEELKIVFLRPENKIEKSNKIHKLGSSYAVMIPKKIIRHIFNELFDLENKKLKVSMKFVEEENTIILSREIREVKQNER